MDLIMYIPSEKVAYWYIPQVRKRGIFQRHICTHLLLWKVTLPLPPPPTREVDTHDKVSFRAG